MEFPLGPELRYGFNLCKIAIFLVTVSSAIVSQMDPVCGDTFDVYYLIRPPYPSLHAHLS